MTTTELLPALRAVEGVPKASSLDIAANFGKRHDNVLRDIRLLIDECPADFTALNFEASEYQDATGRTIAKYDLTRDAFTLLAMGFTGKAALEWKLKYIEAFNAMEKALLQGYGSPLEITGGQKETLRNMPEATRRVLFKELANVARSRPEAMRDYLDMATVLYLATSPKAPEEPGLVTVFWQTFDELEALGYKLNYTIDPTMIAVNLPQFIAAAHGAGLGLFDRLEMCTLLPLGTERKLLAKNRAMRDPDTGKTVKCWLFQREGG